MKSAAQQSATIFSTSKSAAQNLQLIFIVSEAQRNFRYELFDSVKAQHNTAIVKRHFRTNLKRNITSAIEIWQHNANIAFFCDFRLKKSK